MSDSSRPPTARGIIDVIDHAGAEKPAEPSATVLLVRDGPEGELEILMVHRGQVGEFGGVWAFPGGVIEASDVPDGTAPDPLPAARRAAARESMEEVGLEIDAESLLLWSHWVPDTNTALRRFSTWFFLAVADDRHDDEQVGVDGEEIRDHRWIAPSLALGLHERHEILLVPPTYVTLHQLIRYGDVASAVAAAEPEYFATRLVYEGDQMRYCIWHGDVAYESRDLDAPGPRHRLHLDDANGWAYTRTT